MTDYKEWFERNGSCYIKTGYWEGSEQPTIEGLYQAFKARMLDETKPMALRELSIEEVKEIENMICANAGNAVIL